MPGVATYDASQVVATIAGIPILGPGPEQFINIEQNEDSFGLTVGAAGEAARNKVNNFSAMITITLLQTSATNDLLSALHNLDINSPSGSAIGPFLCRDNSGRLLVSAPTSWIQKPPPVTFARGIEVREWQLATNQIIWANIGGNPLA